MSPAKVVLITNYPADQQESMLRFGSALADQLRRRGTSVSTWSCPQLISGWVSRNSFGSHTRWLGYVDKLLLGMLSLLWHRLTHPGVIWHVVDHGNAIYGNVLPWKRVVVTCHDCIAIEEAFFGRTGERVGRFGTLLQRGIARAMEKAGLVIAVSQTTADDLCRLTKRPPQKTIVVHNGLLSVYRRLTPEQVRAKLAGSAIKVDRPFVFMIGSNLKRKNRLGAIDSFNHYRRLSPSSNARLIMAGKAWSREIHEAVAQSEFGADIIEAGTLSDEALEAAYNGAQLVIFPSLAEGFGLPVIEAQACGALVVASEVPPMPEVGGEGALYADATNGAEYAKAMVDALRLDGLLRGKALDNVRRFAASDWASAYALAYERLAQEI